MQTAPDLSRYQFSTGSPGEAAAFVRSVYAAADSELLDDGSGFRFESGFAQNGSFSLEYIRAVGYGRLNLRPLRAATVVQVTRGAATIGHDREQHALGVGDIALLGAHTPLRIEWRDPLVTVARMDIDELERVGARAPGQRVDLDRVMTAPAGPPQAAHLRATLDYMRRDVLSNAPIADSSFVRNRATEMLAAAILNTFGNGADSHADHPEVPADAPASVLRACRFMDAEARAPISVDDVALATRVSKRTLQAAFQRHLGITPSHYLTSVRLAGAHRELLAEDPQFGTTVDQVMRAWHFSNSGRFARLYREAFSELPRATLNR